MASDIVINQDDSVHIYGSTLSIEAGDSHASVGLQGSSVTLDTFVAQGEGSAYHGTANVSCREVTLGTYIRNQSGTTTLAGMDVKDTAVAITGKDVALNSSGGVEINGANVKADVGFNGGVIELSGSNFKTSVSNLQMMYYGGHLTTASGNVELTADGGVLKIAGGKGITLAAAALTVNAPTVTIGTMNLLQAITALQTAVSQLTARVAVLEKGGPK